MNKYLVLAVLLAVSMSAVRAEEQKKSTFKKIVTHPATKIVAGTAILASTAYFFYCKSTLQHYYIKNGKPVTEPMINEMLKKEPIKVITHDISSLVAPFAGLGLAIYWIVDGIRDVVKSNSVSNETEKV